MDDDPLTNTTGMTQLKASELWWGSEGVCATDVLVPAA